MKTTVSATCCLCIALASACSGRANRAEVAGSGQRDIGAGAEFSALPTTSNKGLPSVGTYWTWHISSPILVTAQSPDSEVIKAASELLARNGLKWGEPLRVEWQGKPLNRFLVVYPTPEPERGIAGKRTVQVETNGQIWLPPRG